MIRDVAVAGGLSALFLVTVFVGCSTNKPPTFADDGMSDGGGAVRGSVVRASVVALTPEEVAIVMTMSPLPRVPDDPTNRYADDPRAARLGQFLFFDERLSANGNVSCASCHLPEEEWSDGRALPLPRFGNSLRHVPSLWNVAYNRWHFWDGRADSLWAQALDPLEHPDEHGGTRQQYASLVASDPALRRAYGVIFGEVSADTDNTTPSPEVDRIFVNIGKAMAAYQRKIVSSPSAFDVYVEGVRSGDPTKQGALSASAVRGLKLFIGSANCRACHHGPNFTDGEFHDNGIVRATRRAPTDTGRFQGINQLMASPFNAMGEFSDDPRSRTESPTSFLVNMVERKGQFKTPTLRNVELTAPYMHRGQLQTLEDVVEFYSTLQVPEAAAVGGSSRTRRMLPQAGAAPSHMHGGGEGEHVLKALNLSKQEADDLVAFLKSLTGNKIDPALKVQPATPDGQ